MIFSLHEAILRTAAKISKQELKDEIIAFLKKNPNPSDDKVHSWAEKKGYDTHRVEAEIYELATRMVKLLTGGRSGGKGPGKKIDPSQIRKGIKVEFEHVDDKELARKIAIDHLYEHPDYYKL